MKSSSFGLKLIGLLAILALSAGAIAVAGAAAEAPPAEESAASSEGALPASEASPLAEESCESGNFCVWTQAEFQGVRSEQRCTFGAHSFEHKKFSAKNRCPNRRTVLHEPSEAYVKCMEPGTNQANPNGFFEVVVGNVGESC